MNLNWEPYALGVLAEDGYATNYYSSIFVNNANDLQCSIRIISGMPNSFPSNQRTVTVYGTEFEEHGFEDEHFDRTYRINSLKEFLSDMLLVFQVDRKSTPRGDFYNARNIHLIPKKSSFQEDMSFTPIPLFMEKKQRASGQDTPWEPFVKNLVEGTYVGRNDHISKELDDTPGFLLYRTAQSEYYAAGEFDSHHHAHGGFSFTSEEGEIRHAVISREITDEIYFFQDVAFVGLDEESRILAEVRSGRPITDITGAPQPAARENAAVEAAATILQEKAAAPVATATLPAVEKPAVPSAAAPEAEEKAPEELFMNQFIAETKRMNLVYNLEDLYNFHTCVKSGSLTILAGMSGTGKSQLINAYQRGLHIDSGKFLMIPVSPTWTDDTDLIGYPDMMNNVYRPAESGLVNLLIEADKNRSETFIVCFDEMNLAKVEHYFSQFLSVLEMERGRRKLKLYNRDLQNKFYNGDYYPPEVQIGENVIFTGTVNLDESTHQFSDKVLDRANLIKLDVMPFRRLLEEEPAGEKAEPKLKTSFAVHEFVVQDKKIGLTGEELDFLWDVHEALRELSDNQGIGPRIVKQIDSYLKNIGNLPDCPIDRGTAFDLQFTQRVMPKLRGSEDLLSQLIGRYDHERKTAGQSVLTELFDQYGEVSDFTRSRRMAAEKAKELMRNGYAF
ncbi:MULTISPECIES: McrB family protein [Bhargavaea]|uniref:McrB family protein n=1 Tax=Bhargavaea changchunensis TaxID=2134037 RepID=A0ABW2NAS7_9BACL|nr:AAA family ATPase [Bhargavaea sp. CC-171006]